MIDQEKKKRQDKIKNAIFIWSCIVILIVLLTIAKRNITPPEPEPNYIEEISDEELREIELDE